MRKRVRKYVVIGIAVMALSMGSSVYQMRGLQAGNPVQAGHYGPYWVEHTVVYGETVGELAVKYGSTVKAIKDVNRLINANNISPGTKLMIPIPEDLD